MMYNYDDWSEIKDMARFSLTDQNYKGYTLTFSVTKGTWKNQINLKFEKNGKSLTYTKTFDNADSPNDIYDALVREAKTVIDYIEYQVTCSVDKVKEALSKPSRPFAYVEPKDEIRHYDEFSYEEDDSESDLVEESKSDLESWFKNTDTTRFLKELGDKKNA